MYIALEGLNFSGKSTIASKLSDKFNNSLVTCQPSIDTSNGSDIREILLENKNLSSKAENYLFLADRWQHIKEIIEPNRDDKLIICDRNELSSLVFQGYMKDNQINIIKMHEEIFANHKPDITFFIDIHPKTVISRQQKYLDRLDSNDIQTIALRRHSYFRAINYLSKEYDYSILVIDGERETNKIVNEIENIIKKNYLKEGNY